jgi:hypothetical protein
MFQNFHPADIKWLALYYIDSRQCKIPGSHPSGSMLPGRFFPFQRPESLRLSGGIHNDSGKIRQCGLAFNLF